MSERIVEAIRRNVERAVERFARGPDLRRKIKAGQIQVVGAI